MNDRLYPTPTRLRLLTEVRDRQVTRYPPVHGCRVQSYLPDGTLVTARIAELERAGWIEAGDRLADDPDSPSWWRLTDEGVSLLAEHSPARPVG